VYSLRDLGITTRRSLQWRQYWANEALATFPARWILSHPISTGGDAPRPVTVTIVTITNVLVLRN
jgi:hypothetical protein